MNAVEGGEWVRRWGRWVGPVALLLLLGISIVILRPGGSLPSRAGSDEKAEGTNRALMTQRAAMPSAAGPPSASGPGITALTATVVAAAMGGLAGAGNPALLSAGGTPTDGPPLIPVRDGAPVWSAVLVKQPPRLDGWLDDWLGPPMPVDAVVMGRDAWRDVVDGSGEAYFVWTADFLGLAVHVIDEQFVAPPSGPRQGQGDSVELQLDTDLAGDWESGVFSADDWQIGLSPGDFAGRAPEVTVFRPGALRALTGARIVARRVADGYTIEVLIPWTELGIPPHGLTSLGVAVNLVDRDAPGAMPPTVVSSSPRRTESDPRTFGTLVLAGEGGAGLIEAGRPHGVAP